MSVVVTTGPRTRVVISSPDRPTVVVRPPARRRVTVSPTARPGLSAYELAVAAGFVGTVEQWLSSLHATGSGLLYTRAVAAAQWSIEHAFGRPPAVQLVVDGQVALADVEHPDPTHVLITFATPTAGLAVLT